jgi:hypothetical protein
MRRSPLFATRSEKTGGTEKAISAEAIAVSEMPSSRPAVAVVSATAATDRIQLTM